jgi:hypothetical protein
VLLLTAAAQRFLLLLMCTELLVLTSMQDTLHRKYVLASSSVLAKLFSNRRAKWKNIKD